jgi:hypothetical protein
MLGFGMCDCCPNQLWTSAGSATVNRPSRLTGIPYFAQCLSRRRSSAYELSDGCPALQRCRRWFLLSHVSVHRHTFHVQLPQNIFHCGTGPQVHGWVTLFNRCCPFLFHLCGYNDLCVEVLLGQSENLTDCKAFINTVPLTSEFIRDGIGYLVG